MRNMAAAEIMANEEWEQIDELDGARLYQYESTHGTMIITFGEFYMALQEWDYLSAMLFIRDAFEPALKTKDTLAAFILHVHRLAAKHLVLTCSDEEGRVAGELTTKQTFVTTSKGFVPTPVPVAKVPDVFNDFCVKLLDKINANDGNLPKAVSVAAYAVAEIGCIHPFVNGNGRVGRLLMNAILIYSGHCPVSFVDKRAYYHMIEQYSHDQVLTNIINYIFRSTLTRQRQLDVSPSILIAGLNDPKVQLGSKTSDLVFWLDKRSDMVICSIKAQIQLTVDAYAVEKFMEAVADRADAEPVSFLLKHFDITYYKQIIDPTYQAKKALAAEEASDAAESGQKAMEAEGAAEASEETQAPRGKMARVFHRNQPTADGASNSNSVEEVVEDDANSVKKDMATSF